MNPTHTVTLLCALGLSAGLVGCDPDRNRPDKSVPLTLIGEPHCPEGTQPKVNHRVNIKATRVGAELTLGPRSPPAKTTSNLLAGKKATVRIGFCPEVGECGEPDWVATTETWVGGNDDGVAIILPKFSLPCSDGTSASN